MRVCSIEGCNEKHEAKGYCKRHYRSYYKYDDPLQIERNKRKFYEENHKIIDGVEYKKCKICEEWYPCNDKYFYKNKSNKDGLHPYCKKCTSKKSFEYEKAHPEKRKISIKKV